MLGYPRRHLFIALATILCIASISWVALAYFFPSPPSKFVIAGSFPGGHYERLAHVCFGPKADIRCLFDHLIGAGEQIVRHYKPERFGGLEIDNGLELG